MKKQRMVMSTLYCDACGQPFTIARKVAKQREPGHVKHMYCAYCKETTAFIEGIPHDDSLSFWDEWHNQHAKEEME